MPIQRTLIHAASNDDRWYLCRGDDPADVFVFHEPNGPSGGAASRIELAAFLAAGRGSPEHRALLTRIGSLVRPARTRAAEDVAGPEPGAAGAEPSPGEAVSPVQLSG